MTEALMLFGIGFSSIFLIDPFYGGALTGSGPAKAVVLLLVFGPMLLHFPGRILGDIGRWRQSVGAVARDWWPISLLAMIITVGSLVARYAKGIEETFLNVGLGMFFLPLMALAIDVSAKREIFLKILVIIYVTTACAMYAVAAANLHTLHEQIFVAVPLGMYFLTAKNLNTGKILLGLTLIFGTLVAFKNTTFILIVFSVAVWVAVCLARVVRSKDSLRAVTVIYLGVVVFFALLLIGVIIWWERRNNLPDGNTGYRIEMYGIAIRRFLSSPVWGNGFTEPSVSFFRLYEVAVGTNYLPTHSDVLDMLAHGGIIAVSLWLATIWKILQLTLAAFIAVTSPGVLVNERGWRWLFVIAMMQIGAVITYAFNPPLIRLINGLWIWGGAGIMWALHRSLVATSTTPQKNATKAAPPSVTLSGRSLRASQPVNTHDWC